MITVVVLVLGRLFKLSFIVCFWPLQKCAVIASARAHLHKSGQKVAGWAWWDSLREKEIKTLTVASSSLLSLVSSLLWWPAEERASLLRLVSVPSVCLSPSRPRWKHGYCSEFHQRWCRHSAYSHHPLLYISSHHIFLPLSWQPSPTNN